MSAALHSAGERAYGLTLPTARSRMIVNRKDILVQAFHVVGDIRRLEHGADADQEILHLKRFADKIICAGVHAFLEAACGRQGR